MYTIIKWVSHTKCVGNLEVQKLKENSWKTNEIEGGPEDVILHTTEQSSKF